jgi:copper chaperone NosL
MLLASASLLMLFLFPVWRITLEAPQFPEGLYLDIWVNKLTGQDDYVLQNVNILNHYIGMQEIHEDSIPELQYFPYIVIGMSVLGVLLVLLNKRKLYLGWCIVLLILAIFGMYDFYLWEYDYGHNLDPNAPIKVPGMVYQPPLFGEKALLNFNAISYPALGSLFLFLSMVFSFLAFFFKRN